MWRQVAIPENGHQGILLITVRRRSDRVDRAPGWMSSAKPPEVNDWVPTGVYRWVMPCSPTYTTKSLYACRL